ncbi:vWA domain-containing protein [Ponticoccus alexandrii]|uniref:VWA domain-containing protein n=1 Tax=Ponticoccus alexandrii TaxID=1943633 RepID=A0ABX7FFL3_9RHOB|nr:vWA domain-containing protein [Ponticoccus alexandrii]QRF68528.1 VWA domain-containing protein [Ponticoccus alexandrii]
MLSSPALADRVSVLVFDASGSMWNRVEGDLSRIEVARDVMGEYFQTRDATIPLSVIAYGHNRRGDCGDIEVVSAMAQDAPADLERRLRALMPRGMTPLTDSLALARGQIPQSAEAADIILVTDGLETCEGDPCALAAELAAEGIDIRAHVVGFGLSRSELEGLSCITDQTGGLMFDTNSGAELAEALRQVSVAPPAPEAAPEPAAPEAAFDLGDKAEAGFAYVIRWNGAATNVDYLGFVPPGESRAAAGPGFQTIGGTSSVPANPVTRTAPLEPGQYELIISTARDGVIARQAVEVVAPHMGFEAVGSVEPGTRVRFLYRGPERAEERIVIARPGDGPAAQIGDWDYALHKDGAINLKVPAEAGEYEVRYLNRGRTEILFSRRFGVGIPFEDADLTRAADLAAAAAAATRAAPGQHDIAAVAATFSLPPGLPDSPVSWDGVPLDADMQPEAWAPMETGHSISADFEPGTWRITARAPGEVVYSADVAIFPGQPNTYTLTLVDDALDGALEGGWTLWAIPPREIDDQPMEMAQIALRLTQERQDYVGDITPGPGMGPNAVAGPLQAVLLDHDDVVLIDIDQPRISVDPIRLALSPQGAGFVGTMTAGGQSVPVAFWPQTEPQPLPLWRDAAFGADTPGDAGSADMAFTCIEPRCEVTVDGLYAVLEEGWSMSHPAWESGIAGAHALSAPRVDFLGPEGARLHLNPHQWLADNGPCMSTGAGALCLWKDGPASAAAAAVPLASALELREREAALAPGASAVLASEPIGSMAVEPDDGSSFAAEGPYMAGAEVVVLSRRGQDRRPEDEVRVFGPNLEELPLPAGNWLNADRAAVRMPETPGRYALAIFDRAATSLRGVTEVEVAADPSPSFTRINPNPRAGRSYWVSIAGRMASDDRIAILTGPGDTVVDVGLFEALDGDLRLPEGAFGAVQLVYRTGDLEVLAHATIDVGGPPVLAASDGSSGPAEITMTGALMPGAQVEVRLSGMIPASEGTVGFIAAGSPDLTILQTGTRVSVAQPSVSVTVPEGPGPWALRLIDQNLITVAEITPDAASGTGPAADPAADLIPVDLPDGMTADDLFNRLVPTANVE